MKINEIIPEKDLHWYEEENKYLALSRSEIDEILKICADQGLGDEDIDNVIKIVNWNEKIKISQMLWKSFSDGKIAIQSFDENNEPIFAKWIYKDLNS